MQNLLWWYHNKAGINVYYFKSNVLKITKLFKKQNKNDFKLICLQKLKGQLLRWENKDSVLKYKSMSALC